MALGTFTVHAGHFKKGNWSQYESVFGNLHMEVKGKFFREKISVRHISHLEVASRENVQSFLGSAMGSWIGGSWFGKPGALAGAITGGRKTEVTFICTLDDGRKFLATASSDIFRQLQAALFDNQLKPGATSVQPQPQPAKPGSASPSFWLILGMFFVPFVFVWFTLQKKYSKKSRIISFIWLAISVIAVISTEDK